MMGPQPLSEDENFCLRWNDYEKKYLETFRTLRDDEHFADVTLACEGHAVKAHRIILCACSGYFGHILRTINPAQHPVLLLSDVRPTDLTALMDFIYFGQVNIAQDSLQSFLKIADKLKIKGLCERPLIQPETPLHATITLPIKEEKKSLLGGHGSFESILSGRAGSYIQDPNSPVAGQQVVTVPLQQQSTPLSRLGHSVSSSAPPAHQSPKHSVPGRGTTRPPEQQYMIISSPKKAKYSVGASHGHSSGGQGHGPASILRNQLVTKETGHSHSHSHTHSHLSQQQSQGVEVKSEPLAMALAGTANSSQQGSHQHHDSGQHSADHNSTVSVTEFITTEGDLSLPPLPHGMGSQFMFGGDPSPGDPGAIAPAPAALVTIQPEKETVSSVGSSYSTTRVVSVSVPGSLNSGHPDSLGGPGPPTPVGGRGGGGGHPDQEPQDLTPGLQESPQVQQQGLQQSHTSPDTPGIKKEVKERNSRKQCPYCHKDFHEMSLKRHIKDVHFRDQNTYVICPQCMKQYASQNSLYSHLNRVHGVKKDEIHLQLSGGQVDAKYEEAKYEEHDNSLGHDGLLAIRHGEAGEASGLHAQHQEQGIIVRQQEGEPQGIIVRQQHTVDTNHEGIMDLAQHSDHSN